MKKMYSAIAIVGVLGVSVTPLYADMHNMPAMKDQPMGEMKDHNMSGMGDQMQNTHRGQGTVKGIDAKTGKVNLSHGPITSLNWPAMTMGFPVKDAALLEGIQAGMKVDFELEKSGGGYRIVSIKPSN
ncbi:MAG TPA: copper-binding protein [Gammaproteobacteria bacterium]|nr:copper-binding protein [Gammaproteobacteria bacterium]